MGLKKDLKAVAIKLEDCQNEAVISRIAEESARFKLELNDNSFYLKSKKELENSAGEAEFVNINIPLDKVIEFFNKFNLDGEDFIEDKLTLFKFEGKNGVKYYLISEDEKDELLDEYGEEDEDEYEDIAEEEEEDEVEDDEGYDEEDNEDNEEYDEDDEEGNFLNVHKVDPRTFLN